MKGKLYGGKKNTDLNSIFMGRMVDLPEESLKFPFFLLLSSFFGIRE
jgi:hypothetical protein